MAVQNQASVKLEQVCASIKNYLYPAAKNVGDMPHSKEVNTLECSKNIKINRNLGLFLLMAAPIALYVAAAAVGGLVGVLCAWAAFQIFIGMPFSEEIGDVILQIFELESTQSNNIALDCESDTEKKYFIGA